MTKIISIEASKYSIEYDPAKQWDYHITVSYTHLTLPTIA